MKTRTYFLMLALIGLFMMSCTSSLQVSKTSSWNDEIYGSSAKPETSQLALNQDKGNLPEKNVNSDLDKLEQKYANEFDINLDSIKNDTVIYKAEDTNPYSRILSDSFQESYERRLRGLEDPRYGMEDWTLNYSESIWYANTYDPAFYNVIVMGGQVWVEPWYISTMFGWPRTNFSIGFGFGWNYSYWNYNPWYYGGWNNGYWYGYNNYYGNNFYHNNYYGNDYYYGRRSTNTTSDRITRTTPSGVSRTSGNQAVISRRSGESTSNPIVSSRRTQTRVTPTYESRTREGGNTSRSDGSAVSNRTERYTRERGISEPTRNTYNQPSGSRTGNARTRVTEGSDSQRSSTGRTSNSTRSTTPTYNRPSRVNTPASTSGGNQRTSSSDNKSSSSSSSSYGSSRSSSSSSSGSSGSSRSSSSSSSSSSSRKR